MPGAMMCVPPVSTLHVFFIFACGAAWIFHVPGSSLGQYSMLRGCHRNIGIFIAHVGWAMPGGARWDRKVKTKLGKKHFFYRYLYTSMCICGSRIGNRATGTVHARLPSGDYGASRCHFSTPPPVALPGRTCCGWALAEVKLKQQPTLACRPVGVWHQNKTYHRAVPAGTGYRYRCRAL
jgi:hypothetical protein